MTVADKHIIRPRKIRLDASTVCQLKCPACPTAGGATGRRIGAGFLKFEDFKKFVNDNPRVAHIELSNWGEVLLNKDLDKNSEIRLRAQRGPFLAQRQQLQRRQSQDSGGD